LREIEKRAKLEVWSARMLHDADVVLHLGSLLVNDVVATCGRCGGESNHTTHGRAHTGHLTLERGTVSRLCRGSSVIASVVVGLKEIVVIATEVHHGRLGGSGN
jgi:hypothetical protein